MHTNVKQVVLIGNRCGVVREIGRFPQLRLTRVFALAESLLDRECGQYSADVVRFALSDRRQVCEQIAVCDFDLLLSHGCPFILPVSELRRHHQRFINVHPAPLPRMKGMHPVNGAFLRGENFLGATMHDMEDHVDAGRIIEQGTIELTADLDLGLAYRLVFDLESDVFRRGMQKLIDSGFQDQGEPQSGDDSFYTRRRGDMRIDFRTMSNDEIVRRVRAFGIASQGVIAEFGRFQLRVFDAESMFNPHLLVKYAAAEPGTVLLQYEKKWLVRSRDGVIKINRAETL